MSILRDYPPAHACEKQFCAECARFAAWYRLTGDAETAMAKAQDLVVEQTIEFPLDLVTDPFITDHVVGKIDRLVPGQDGVYRALISFANDDTAGELTQLLNVLFGNISLKPGIRLDSLKDCPGLWDRFRGPRFGREGLRQRLRAPGRALLATAVKPMGESAQQLAARAYQFARGGIDVIKDDHGLSNQPYARFEERVARCSEAVAKANAETGYHSVYAPNVTAAAGETELRAHFAKSVGAGALLVAPGLCGFDAMRRLADDDALDLPILGHPAMLGSFVTSPDNGISHYALFGQIMRLAGADAAIYPHAGGRFAFSAADCRSIVAGTEVAMGHLQPSFPAPGGGMTLQRSSELKAFYGSEVMYLVGGDLLRHSPDVEKNCALFRELVQQA